MTPRITKIVNSLRIQPSWIEILFRLILGGIFCLASIPKLYAPLDFADAMYGLGVVPAKMINIVALGLPGVELYVGALLISNYRSLWPPIMAVFLCVVFLFVMTVAVLNGRVLNCGCFGGNFEWRLGNTGLLIRNTILFLWAIVPLISTYRRTQQSQLKDYRRLGSNLA